MGFVQFYDWEQTKYLKGLSVVEHVPGVINSVDSEVKEGTGRTQVQVKRNKATLNKSICVSVQVVVHHKACAEHRTEHIRTSGLLFHENTDS